MLRSAHRAVSKHEAAGLARQQEHRLLAEQVLREERHGDAELACHRR